MAPSLFSRQNPQSTLASHSQPPTHSQPLALSSPKRKSAFRFLNPFSQSSSTTSTTQTHAVVHNTSSSTKSTLPVPSNPLPYHPPPAYPHTNSQTHLLSPAQAQAQAQDQSQEHELTLLASGSPFKVWINDGLPRSPAAVTGVSRETATKMQAISGLPGNQYPSSGATRTATSGTESPAIATRRMNSLAAAAANHPVRVDCESQSGMATLASAIHIAETGAPSTATESKSTSRPPSTIEHAASQQQPNRNSTYNASTLPRSASSSTSIFSLYRLRQRSNSKSTALPPPDYSTQVLQEGDTTLPGSTSQSQSIGRKNSLGRRMSRRLSLDSLFGGLRKRSGSISQSGEASQEAAPTNPVPKEAIKDKDIEKAKSEEGETRVAPAPPPAAPAQLALPAMRTLRNKFSVGGVASLNGGPSSLASRASSAKHGQMKHLGKLGTASPSESMTSMASEWRGQGPVGSKATTIEHGPTPLTQVEEKEKRRIKRVPPRVESASNLTNKPSLTRRCSISAMRAHMATSAAVSGGPLVSMEQITPTKRNSNSVSARKVSGAVAIKPSLGPAFDPTSKPLPHRPLPAVPVPIDPIRQDIQSERAKPYSASRVAEGRAALRRASETPQKASLIHSDSTHAQAPSQAQMGLEQLLSPARDDMSILDPGRSPHRGFISVESLLSPAYEAEVQSSKSAVPETQPVHNVVEDSRDLSAVQHKESLIEIKDAFARMKDITGLDVSEPSSRRVSGASADSGADTESATIREAGSGSSRKALDVGYMGIGPTAVHNDTDRYGDVELAPRGLDTAVSQMTVKPSSTAASELTTALSVSDSTSSGMVTAESSLSRDGFADDDASELSMSRAQSGRSWHTAKEDSIPFSAPLPMPGLPRSRSKSTNELSSLCTSRDLVEQLEKQQGEGWWSSRNSLSRKAQKPEPSMIPIPADDDFDKKLEVLERLAKSSTLPHRAKFPDAPPSPSSPFLESPMRKRERESLPSSALEYRPRAVTSMDFRRHPSFRAGNTIATVDRVPSARQRHATEEWRPATVQPRQKAYFHGPRMSLVGDSTWPPQGDDGSPVRRHHVVDVVSISPRRSALTRRASTIVPLGMRDQGTPTRAIAGIGQSSEQNRHSLTAFAIGSGGPFASRVSPDIARRASFITRRAPDFDGSTTNSIGPTAMAPESPSLSRRTTATTIMSASTAPSSLIPSDEEDFHPRPQLEGVPTMKLLAQAQTQPTELKALLTDLAALKSKYTLELDAVLNALSSAKTESTQLKEEMGTLHKLLSDGMREREELRDRERRLQSRLEEVERDKGVGLAIKGIAAQAAATSIEVRDRASTATPVRKRSSSIHSSLLPDLDIREASLMLVSPLDHTTMADTPLPRPLHRLAVLHTGTEGKGFGGSAPVLRAV